MTLVLNGAGLALGGARTLAALCADETPPGEVDPAAVLGRRGLLYKDRATQLALCAARDALADAGLLEGEEAAIARASTAAVVSSNLGNLDTVCRVAAEIASGTTAVVSPMHLPNASSNVVASTLAIRFGLRGPNLLLCNGDTGGLDAVYWACALLRAGRAQRVLVVGVEPRNDVVARLLPAGPLLDGAVALVVEHADAAGARAVAPLATIGAYAREADLERCVARVAGNGRPDVWFGAADTPALADVPRRDVAAVHGRSSGALGVLQCATALALFQQRLAGRALATAGGDDDGPVAALVLEAA